MPDATITPADLAGTYTITAGEKFGQPEPPERVAGSGVTFTATAVSVTDKSKKETYSATYTLDPATNPCGIVMTATHAPNGGEVAFGLVEKSGDTVRLIYALPGASPPTEFKTLGRQLMFVMTRQKG